MSKIVDDYLSYLKEDKEHLDEFLAAAMTVASAFVTWGQVWGIARDVYERYIDSVGRKCRRLKGTEHAYCVTQGKIQATQKSMQVLRSKRAKCKTLSCKQKVDAKLKEQDLNIKSLENQLSIQKQKMIGRDTAARQEAPQ